MDWSAKIGAFLGDDRLLANLIGIHVGLIALLVVSFVARQLVQSGGQRVLGAMGVSWLRNLTEEATATVRNFVYWVTLGLMAGCVVAGLFYHLAGRDVRTDAVAVWNRHFTFDDVLGLGIAAGKLVGIGIAAWLACSLVHRLRLRMEIAVRGQRLDDPTIGDHADDNDDEVVPPPPSSRASTIKDGVTGWFNVLERFGIALIVLGSLWLASRVTHVTPLETCIRFAIPLVSIVLVARLLALSSNAISRGLANFGDRTFTGPGVARYWERAKQLFPFGQKCFEAVVYVWAGSSIVREIGFHLAIVELYDDRVIACIGIFLATRVVIELSFVLINEAFGLVEGVDSVDQKGQTLAPLLQSVIQYALYFGSLVVMLEMLEGPTHTILAGAGLFGLAVGLGAQSLVSDVVSGFFILFEGQYLVGDHVEIGDANGRVEVVSIRHTQIRDDHGKLFIIPNGQIKTVTNYSKGWVNAVVDVKVPTSMNLETLLMDMTEAGRRLKSTKREVLAETIVRGLVDLTPGDMTVRAITKVMPGTHALMQAEYRRLLKDVFDQRTRKSAA